MKTKLDAVLAAMRAGDWQEAITKAAKFPRLGEERNAVLDAMGAIQNPNFCRQLGKDPEALIAAGREALKRRYQASRLVDE